MHPNLPHLRLRASYQKMPLQAGPTSPPFLLGRWPESSPHSPPPQGCRGRHTLMSKSLHCLINKTHFKCLSILLVTVCKGHCVQAEATSSQLRAFKALPTPPLPGHKNHHSSLSLKVSPPRSLPAIGPVRPGAFSCGGRAPRVWAVMTPGARGCARASPLQGRGSRSAGGREAEGRAQ